MVHIRSSYLVIMFLSLAVLAACATTTVTEPYKLGRLPDILTIHPDGSMRLNERPIDSRDVVIYPDGRGGERAAVKMRVPIHPDYYRDTIIVERLPANDAMDAR